MSPLRLLVSGGGTSGHIYPALAITEAVEKACPGTEVLFAGTREGLEGTLVPKAGLRFEAIPAQGIVGKGPLGVPAAIATAFRGVWAAAGLVRRFRPDVVLGTGGYVSGPVGLAALLGRVPLVIQEQNVFPGLTNRWVSRWAVAVAVPHAGARRYFPHRARLVVTGNPVRASVAEMTPAEGRRILGLPGTGEVIYIVGGSRGARVLNQAAVAALPGWLARPGVAVIFSTGERYYEETRQALVAAGIVPTDGGKITLVPYLHRVDAALAAADLIIARAGGSTLAEVAARGVPAVLVPSPNVTYNHQDHNARVFEEAGAAVVISEAALSGEVLERAVLDILADPDRRDQMSRASRDLGRPEAASEIARLVIEAATPPRRRRKGTGPRR
jgi:UDP-N-acetylglucosamine--N-acetylmuramyl-(pentapeptide) pyrophosphoryl-undecaprenol N-acetylglucosamine transferase